MNSVGKWGFDTLPPYCVSCYNDNTVINIPIPWYYVCLEEWIIDFWQQKYSIRSKLWWFKSLSFVNYNFCLLLSEQRFHKYSRNIANRLVGKKKVDFLFIIYRVIHGGWFGYQQKRWFSIDLKYFEICEDAAFSKKLYQLWYSKFNSLYIVLFSDTSLFCEYFFIVHSDSQQRQE